MPTTTTNFSFQLPIVGSDTNAWGGYLNANWTALDGLLYGSATIRPDLATGLWEIGGVAVTATAAELNILDGVTATTSELNILDGVTATASEINTLDGITASTAELNILDGATLTVTELNYVGGVTSAIQTQLNTKYSSANLASQAEAQAGTVNTTLMTPLRTAEAIEYRQRVFHLVDEKTNGTAGDLTVATTWTVRTLNTTRTNTLTGASVAANVVTLPAGRYRVTASDPAYNTDHHRLRLYNVTAAAVLVLGPVEYARSSADAHSTTALLDGFFTLASTSNVRLEHWCALGSGTSYFGLASSSGSTEVYASIIFEWLGPT